MAEVVLEVRERVSNLASMKATITRFEALRDAILPLLVNPTSRVEHTGRELVLAIEELTPAAPAAPRP